MRRELRFLQRQKLRSFLSTIGILFGVAAVVTMFAIGEGAKRETLEQIAQLGLNTLIIRQSAPSSFVLGEKKEQKGEHLTWSDIEILRRFSPFFPIVAPVALAPIPSSSLPAGAEILQVTPEYLRMKQFVLREGRFLCDLDIAQRKNVCLLGHQAARCILKYGKVGQSIQLGNTSYLVIGILQPCRQQNKKNQGIAHRNFDQVIFIPLEGIFSSAPSQQTEISEIWIETNPLHSIYTYGKLVHSLLQSRRHAEQNYQIVVPQELFEQAARAHRTFNWILGSIAAISLLVGGIGVMNIMLASVSERTKEIGIRRSIGASRAHIFRQFLIETLILTFIGAFLGVFVGCLLSFVIGHSAGWEIHITFWSILLSVGMSLIIGVCSALYPALRAASIDPITALRHP